MADMRRAQGVTGERRLASRYRVLVVLSSLAEAQVLVPLANLMARERYGRVMILQVVKTPDEQPLSRTAPRVSRHREALDTFLSENQYGSPRTRTIVRPAQRVWDAIWETVVQERVQLLLLAWPSSATPDTAVDNLGDPRLDAPPCDVVVVRINDSFIAQGGWPAMRRILLPVRGGPHSGMALRVAHALARASDATVTLLHEMGSAQREEQSAFESFAHAMRSLKGFVRVLSTRGNVVDAIVEHGNRHQLVVMGAAARQTDGVSWGGTVLRAVTERLTSNLVVAKVAGERAWRAPTLTWDERVVHDHPIAVVVDRWFAENTFRSDEFSDLQRLVALKERERVRISLGLPALNEEATVGNVIATVKETLMDEVPLLDEIVLIDSGSQDRTCEIATQLGIPVYVACDILPQYGTYRGKGEALWKSLYVLNGDIIAWIDTDIRNIHPRFVYGILGPLLRDPRIQYVKGFYRRPLQQGDRLEARAGGRVTELTARPLLNLFFPELSGLIQPLAGEYAGRRQILEQLPFFTGYGVEFGLLVDILERFGLSAIAQVDLLERVHRNQPLPSLSKMSFAILQVAMRRLEQRHKIRIVEEINESLNQIRYRPGYFYLEPIEIVEHERPPIITLPEYRAKRKLDEGASGEK
ncbi:MAG: glucosyl-3-phosphoglycerate synthase [Anaerolineae bacterium]